ncbi:transcription factor A, mitochondrial isoform X2 [Calonectris borealis]|uniref:transcription factor A, mitochondrial isoform X2 n=1 Tax=Calonectris borealis TaxID=1323832 RepID=UPI003F4B8629
MAAGSPCSRPLPPKGAVPPLLVPPLAARHRRGSQSLRLAAGRPAKGGRSPRVPCGGRATPARAGVAGGGMAAALALLGRAAGLVAGAQRLLRGCGVGGSAERCLCRGISSDQRPKRPLTAYFRFLKENHSAFRQKNPEMNNVELVKKIASAWKELPASQKQVYEEARKTDWQRYEEQLAAYKAQLSPAQAAALREEKRRRLAKRRSFRAKRAKLKQLFDAWRKMSSSQKQPYLQLAEDDKVRYENEMKSWEAKMVELGREDLIRSTKQRPKKITAETAKKAQPAKASLHEKKAKLKLKKSEE